MTEPFVEIMVVFTDSGPLSPCNDGVSEWSAVSHSEEMGIDFGPCTPLVHSRMAKNLPSNRMGRSWVDSPGSGHLGDESSPIKPLWLNGGFVDSPLSSPVTPPCGQTGLLVNANGSPAPRGKGLPGYNQPFIGERPPVLNSDNSDAARKNGLSVKAFDSSLYTKFCVFGIGGTSVEEYKKATEKLLDGNTSNYTREMKQRVQPNGEARIEFYLLNDVSLAFKHRFQSIRKRLGWRLTYWRTWKSRHGNEAGRDMVVVPPRIEKPTFTNIGTYNVNGYFSKSVEVQEWLERAKVTIALLQETLIRPGQRFEVPGFTVFRRSAEFGGAGLRGQAVLIREGLKAIEIDTGSPYLLGVKVFGLPGDRPWTIVSAYLPSGGNHRGSRAKIIKFLRKWLRRQIRNDPNALILVGGDFNIERVKLEKASEKWRIPVGLLNIRGSSKTRLAHEHMGRWTSIDHFIGTKRALCMLRWGSVRRQFDLSDHFPVMTSIRTPDNSANTSPKLPPVKLVRSGFEGLRNKVANSNRFALLADLPASNRDELDVLSSGFVGACKEVAAELKLLRQPVPDRKRYLPAHVKHEIRERGKLKQKMLKATSLAAKEYASVKYRKQCNKVKALLQREREQYWRSTWQCGAELMRTGAIAAWWDWLNRQTNHKGRNVREMVILKDFNGLLRVDPAEVAEVQARHYEELGKDPSGKSQDFEYWENKVHAAGLFDNSELLKELEWREVVTELRKSKNRSATGPDGIPAEWLKMALANEEECESPKTELGKALYKLYKAQWQLGLVPADDLVSIVVSLFKKGDRTDIGNYRGLSLSNHKNKVFNAVITSRLTNYLEVNGLLCPEQSGFRPGGETIEQVISLCEVVRRRSLEGKETYLFFADMRKAFDMVPHGALLAKLKALGITGPILEVLTDTYRRAKAQVRVEHSFSRQYALGRGTRQGDVPSPILFNVFINDLTKHLKSLGLGINTPGFDQLITALLFADDAVGLADSASQLQLVINGFLEWGSNWGMEFNVPKCGVLLCSTKPELHKAFNGCNFTLGMEPVPHVKEYTYLGVKLTTDFGESSAVMAWAKDRGLKVDAILNTLRPYLRCRQVPIQLRVECLKVLVLPVATYGAEYGSTSREAINYVQSRFNRGLKWVLGSRAGNSALDSSVMVRELGLSTLYEQALCLRARAFMKFCSGGPRVAGQLCSAVIEGKGWRSRSKTWVTWTTWYFKTYVGGCDLVSGLVQEDSDQVIQRIRTVLYNNQWDLAKKGNSLAKTHYMKFDFGRSRNFMKQATWQPQMAYGILWMLRLRTLSIRSHAQNVAILRDRGLDSVVSASSCPACKQSMSGAAEWVHLMLHCNTYRAQRVKYIGLSLLHEIKAEAHRLKRVYPPLSKETWGEISAALLLGGLVGESRLTFSKAFGHDPKVVGNFSDLRIFGCLLTAQYLNEIMPIHYGWLNSAAQGRDVGLFSASQSDF